MSVSLFGILWLIIEVAAFIRRNPKYITIVTIICMTLQCTNVVIINGQGIGPQLLSSMVMILYYVFWNARHFQLKVDSSSLAAMSLILVIIISVIVNDGGLSFEKVLKIIQLISYIFCFLTIKKICYVDTGFLDKVMNQVAVFLLAMGVLQLIMTLNIIPKLPVVVQLIYNDTSNPNIAFNQSFYKRICSTFMEPSYYAPVVCALTVHYYLKRNKSKRDVVLLVISLLELLGTYSTTAYIGIALTFVLYVLLDRKNQRRKLNTVALALVAVFGILATSNVLQSVLIDKFNTGSFYERSNWNKKALEGFQNSMLIGLGYKNSRASSLLLQLLGELGFLGFATYMFFMFGQIKFIFKRSSEISQYSWMIVAVLICQMIAIPDLDICSMWLILYIFAINFGLRREELNNEKVRNSNCKL